MILNMHNFQIGKIRVQLNECIRRTLNNTVESILK